MLSSELNYSGLALYEAIASGNMPEITRITSSEHCPGFSEIVKENAESNLLIAAGDNATVLSFLLTQYNANISDQEKETALITATDNNHYEIAQLILENFEDYINGEICEQILEDAVQDNHPRIVQLMADRCLYLINYSTQYTSLSMAVENGNIEIINILLAAGVSPNWNRGTESDEIESILVQLNPLHIAIEQNNPEIVQILLNAGAFIDDINNKGETALAIAIKTHNFQIILMLLKNGYTIFDMPITDLVLDLNSFDNTDVLNFIAQYEHEYELVAILESIHALSETTRLALNLLEIKEHITDLEESRAYDSNIDNDLKINRANQHFNRIVQPHFKASFDSYGETNEARITNIEIKIRELILNYILREGEPSPETINFINEQKADLIIGEKSALEASLPFFQGPSNGASAWRIYNPFAPIAAGADFINLLTPQKDDGSQLSFTTPLAKADLSNTTNYAASNLLRERVAYYYLAAVDDSANIETKPNRILHFINKLQEIRNAQGLDAVSCFPGHITRIAEMGDFHDIAKLPLSAVELIECFFKGQVINEFQETLKACITKESRDNLFNAIIQLTSLNAKEVAVQKNTLSDEFLIIREQFISALGEAEILITEFKTDYPDIHLTDNDNIYFKRHLRDPAFGSIAKALTDYYRNFDNEPASQIQIDNANPFADNGTKIRDVFSIFFNVAIKLNPTPSIQYLNNIVQYLEEKSRIIVSIGGIEKSNLNEIVTQLAPDAEHNISKMQEDITEELNKIGFTIKIINPFKSQIDRLHALRGRIPDAQLDKMLHTTRTKAGLFEQFIQDNPLETEASIMAKIDEKLELDHSQALLFSSQVRSSNAINNNSDNENTKKRSLNTP